MGKTIGNLPLIQKVVAKFDTDIKTYGIQTALALFLRERHAYITTQMQNPSTKEALQKAPVVLVCAQHVSEIDPLALLAVLPPRKDMYLIADALVFGISKQLDKYLIPVYIQNNIRTETPNGLQHSKDWILRKIHQSYSLSPEEEHQKNKASITLAAQKVSAGNMVIIFAGGKGTWYPGVGHMVKEITTKNSAFLIKAYIQGTTLFDVFRLIPPLNRFFPKVVVSISKPQKLSTFEHLTGKNISKILEKHYFSWVNTLEDKRGYKFSHTFAYIKKILKRCLFAHQTNH